MDLVTPRFKSHFRAENRILTVPHPRRSRTKRTYNQCRRFRPLKAAAVTFREGRFPVPWKYSDRGRSWSGSVWRFNHAPGKKCMRLPRVKAKSVREVKCQWYAAARSKEVW